MILVLIITMILVIMDMIMIMILLAIIVSSNNITAPDFSVCVIRGSCLVTIGRSCLL